MAPEPRAGWGNILSLSHDVFYIPPCWKTFLEFSGDLPCEKKKDCEQGRVKLLSIGVLILSYTRRAQNIKILSPPLTFPAWRNVQHQNGQGKNFLAPTGDFLVSRTAIFQRSASF
jgi:hypothetical protein